MYDTYTVTFTGDEDTLGLTLSNGNVTFVGMESGSDPQPKARTWTLGSDSVIEDNGLLHLGQYGGPVHLKMLYTELAVKNGGYLNADYGSKVTVDYLTVGAAGGVDEYSSMVSVQNEATLTADGVTLNPLGSLYITAGYAYLGELTVNGGVIYFNSGLLDIDNDLTVGTDGPLEGLSLTAAHMLIVGGTTKIDPFRTLSLNGGTLTTSALVTGPYNDNGVVENGIFEFNRGTLNITGEQGLKIGVPSEDPGHADYLMKPLGNIVSLGPGQALNVTHTAAVEPGALILLENGGVFNAGTTDNAGEILLDGVTAAMGGTTLNNLPGGLIHGQGRITSRLNNAAGAEVRAEAGKRLVLFGENNMNLGKLNLLGGTLEFTQGLTNGPGGEILGRGLLVADGTGLANQGKVVFSGGSVDVLGPILNEYSASPYVKGSISVSGGADVIFWDDVTQTPGSSFGVSAGSSATFYSAYSGMGITGAGDKYFEADVLPGASPADASFGGNVFFGSNARLEIEVGGLTPGSGHDRINVAQNAALDGTLELLLINGFLPADGDQVTVMTFGSRSGMFSQVNCPGLPEPFQATPLYSAVDLIIDFSLDPTPEIIWWVDGNGNSSEGTNWLGGVAPGATDDAVGFLNKITTDRTVTADAAFTAGTLRFDDDNNYLVEGPGTITLNVSSGSAAVNVFNTHGDGAHAITAPLSLQDDLVITQNSAGTFTLSELDNTSGKTITKTGPGTVVVEGSQTWGAGAALTVSEGALRFNLDGADTVDLAPGASVTVESSASLELAGSLAALSDGADLADVLNDGGLLISGTNQAVGAITGTGDTTVLDGADLTAVSITQGTLTIGGTVAPPAEHVAPVPEPATGVLLAAAAVLLLLRRRGR
ncbi:MAG: PEP-CTERM sorting domain-containing protein [Pirellulales bacterium]|nr:PEP-CTERM sorting domain-containing protein [Pirellulales bacterium]